MLKKTIKKLLNRIVNNYGYRIVNKSFLKSKHFAEADEDFHLGLISYIIATKYPEKVRIVQIGSHDGVTNDPIFQISKKYKKFTKIISVEPQYDQFAVLKTNCEDHPDFVAVNKAVGSEKTMRLWRIPTNLRPYWKNKSAAAITSFNKAFVQKKANQNLPSTIKNSEKEKGNSLVESFDIEAITVKNILKRFWEEEHVDVLQIDTEGLDKEIISKTIKDGIYPNVIFFETFLLTREEFNEVVKFLEDKSYIYIDTSNRDGCAILMSNDF